ncbi:hsc70 cochaperone [Ophiostoma piceae UAMH 11346]|uniref:Hsc70 cochaperone n=1 Tax=Ophiostoma piceae (strain UAMH 11346) TaxID=1262450 RepID=S3CAW9_OPHP1|nr:hsc70 cochaperone [Ophiostoma piceae UAMH 11346]
MSLSTKQRLALAICDFLSTAAAEGGSISADDADNIEVAINGIAEAFKIDPTNKAAVAQAVGAQSLEKIYAVYDKMRAVAPAAAPAAAASPAAAATPAADAPKSTPASEALKSKGNAAMAEKNYDSAIDYYTQALAVAPNNAIYLSNRAAAHSANKDHASARTDAEAATTIDPNYTKAWSRLGLAKFALGDAKGAMEAYSQGIEYEGNGGSDAMKKGFETAKRRVEELDNEAAVTPSESARGPSAAGAGGMPDLSSLLGGAGGAGGAGGMPDLSSIMSNPMFASMAQNLMGNPDLMQNLMGNPRLREMANQFGSGGGMPDLSSLMSDPNIADMARSMMGNGGAGAGRGAGSPPQ